jgi:penicillin-binding protein 1A
MDITAPVTPPKQGKKKKRGGFFLRFLGFVFAACMILSIAVAGAVAFVLWKVSQELPDYENLARYEPPVMTRIHADDGRLIAEYSRQRRIYVPITAVPKRVIDAYLSAEDKNFYQHGGLDIQGIVRALIANLSSGSGGKQGASTITQQVAKNFLLTSDQNIERKLKEAILAIRIERAFTKDQILELYLNEIYLGGGAYGVAAAAQRYWDKALNELTLDEAAYLAVLPKAPSRYHPIKHQKRALARRNWVIDRMVENGFATPDEGEAAKAKPLTVLAKRYGPRIHASEYFAEEVRREILDRFGEDKLYGGGFSVRTSLNPRMQAIAREALVDGLTGYDRSHGGWRGPEKTIEISGDWGKTLADIPVWSDIEPWKLAVVLEVSNNEAKIGLRPSRDKQGQLVTDRETGVIPASQVRWTRKSIQSALKPGDVVYVAPVEKTTKTTEGDEETETTEVVAGEWSLQQVPKVSGALVAMDPHSGRVLAIAGGFSFHQSQFDRATQALRQPGSSFKPLIYLTALDNGYAPNSVILDGRICVSQGRGMPPWCPKNYSGGGAGPSTLRRGIEKSRNLMTVRLSRDIGMPVIAEYSKRFGVYDNLMPALSMSLGAGETTLLRMVTAYSMIANGGRKVDATFIDRIQNRYGRTIWKHDKRECDGCAAREWAGQSEPELVEVNEQVVDPIAAYQMVGIMQGVVTSGTARRLVSLNRPIAGKTGTTNNYKDAWFIGYTPDLVVGSYVGYDQPKPMGRSATGGGLAAPIVKQFFAEALEGVPPQPFRAPEGTVMVPVNHKTGLPARKGQPGTVMEAFKPEQVSASAAAAAQAGEDGQGGESFPNYPTAAAAPAAPPRQAANPPQAASPPPQRRQRRGFFGRF